MEKVQRYTVTDESNGCNMVYAMTSSQKRAIEAILDDFDYDFTIEPIIYTDLTKED
jgi:predicted nucleotide-binding protein